MEILIGFFKFMFVLLFMLLISCGPIAIGIWKQNPWIIAFGVFWGMCILGYGFTL